MSITIVLVALMIQIAGNVLNVWSHTSGTLETENEAAVIFDFLAKDLRGAVMKRDGRVWLAATIQGDQTGSGDAAIAQVSGTGALLQTLEKWDGATVLKPSGQGTANTATSSLNIPAYTPPKNATSTLTTGNMVSLYTPQSPAPSSYRFGQSGVWLRFFTTQPDNAPPTNAPPNTPPNGQNDSVPRAVGYQIARIALTPTDLNAPGSFTYALFRSAVRPWATATDTVVTNVVGKSQPLSTFGVGYDLFYVFTAGVHNTSLVATYSTALTGGTNLGDASNIRRPNMQQLLGNNVIDFGVRFWGMAYDSNHNLMPVLLFPISKDNTGFAATTEDGFTRTVGPAGQSIVAITPPTNFSGNASANMTYAFAYRAAGGAGKPDTPCTPAFCDVFVRILDEEGARLINGIETGQMPVPITTTPQGFWWQTAEQHSQVYTRRIELLASPM